MIRFLTAIVLSLLFCTPTSAENLQLPPEYLGWWNPYSKTTNGYGIKFLPNGTAYYQHEKNKSYYGFLNYTVLDVSNKSVFLLVHKIHEMNEPWTATEIWEISQEDDEWTTSFRFLIVKDQNCGISLKDFIAYNEKPAITSLPKECANYKKPSFFSQTTYSRRK